MRRRPSPLPRFYRWRSNVLQAPVLFVVTGVCGTLALLVSLSQQDSARTETGKSVFSKPEQQILEIQ